MTHLSYKERLALVAVAKSGDKWRHRKDRFLVTITKTTHKGKNPLIQYKRSQRTSEFVRGEIYFARYYEPA